MSLCSKSKIKKKLKQILVMLHEKVGEDFLLHIIKVSCFNLALSQPDHKLSMSAFA